MSILNKTLTVNFGDVSDVPEIRIVQGEEAARVVHFKLSDAAGAINLTGCTARIYILPYGETTPLYEDLTITAASSGKCDYLISGNAAAIAGEGKYWIEILQTGSPDPLSVSYSGEGAIIVAPRQDFTGAIEAGTEFSALLSALALTEGFGDRISALEGLHEDVYSYTVAINAVASAGNIALKRVGNVVLAVGYAVVTGGLSTATKTSYWDALPVGYRPIMLIQNMSCVARSSTDYTTYVLGLCDIALDGVVSCVSTATGKTTVIIVAKWTTIDALPT